MGVNSLPKTVTRQRRDCDLNPGPSAHESSTLTTRLPSYLCRKVPDLRHSAVKRQYTDVRWIFKLLARATVFLSRKKNREFQRFLFSKRFLRFRFSELYISAIMQRKSIFQFLCITS